MGGGRQGRGGNGWMKGTLLVTDDGPSIPYYYDSQIITIEHKYTHLCTTPSHMHFTSVFLWFLKLEVLHSLKKDSDFQLIFLWFFCISWIIPTHVPTTSLFFNPINKNVGTYGIKQFHFDFGPLQRWNVHLWQIKILRLVRGWCKQIVTHHCANVAPWDLVPVSWTLSRPGSPGDRLLQQM